MTNYKRVTVLICTVFMLTNLYSQDTLFAKSWSKPKKIKIIEPYTYMTIVLTATDSFGIRKEINYRGSLRKVNDTSLTFAVQHENVTINKRNVVRRYTNYQYFQSHADSLTGQYYGDEVRIINFKDIDDISVDQSRGSRFADFGGILIGVSFMTAFIVAPLASINYRKSSFNLSRYYAIAGGGLAGMCIGIPISLLGEGDGNYKIKMENEKSDDEYYMLANKKNTP